MRETSCVDDIECPGCGHKFDGASAVNYDMSLMSTAVVCPNCEVPLDIMISVLYTATVTREEEASCPM